MMKSLSTKKIVIAILAVLFAFSLMFAGLTANKASANTDLERVSLSTTMEQSAQMRLTNPTGMRFIINVDEADFDLFGEDVKVVTMITQKNLLDAKGISVEEFDKDTDVKKAEVVFGASHFQAAKDVYGEIKLTATILEISDSNIAKTYVAKTYITDGEKIGYVEQVTEASIYRVATEALKNVNPAEEPENYEVLLGYTKSCTVTLEGTEQTEKVPYGIKISDLVYGAPKCYVFAFKDLDGNPVALDAVVTTDLVMSMSFNHSYVDGACEFCKAACSHSEYENGACVDCGKVCEHEYEGITCGICGNTISSVYNSATDLSTLIAYGYSQTTVWEGNTAGLYFGAVTEVDGKSGNFFSVHFAYDGNGIAKQYVGISIAPSVTLAQLNALKDAGYNKLSVDYYFRHQGGAMTTYKNVYAGSVYTYGQALTGAKEQKALGEWHNFTVSIDDIIANYDGLVNGTKYLMHVQNSRDEGDNAHNSTDGYGHFKAFFGNMQFIVELNTTYNACLSAEGATPTSGKADVAVGTQIGGVTGNYIRFRIWKSYVNFSIPSELTLKEIQTLKDAGYTSLQFNVYIHRVHVAGTDHTSKGCNYLGNGSMIRYNVNEMHTISVSIDDIISNYDGLQAGTTALFHINNGDNWDGPENGNNTLQVWFSNMEFVK